MTQRVYDEHTDVVVIGGGPGGSTAATMMARKGLRVMLLERERFPREHIGESLLPASMPVLEELGVLDEVREAGFLPKYGATMVWGSDGQPWSWYFRETNRRYPHAFQVWRPTFDHILLKNSAAHGVDVREGHSVQEVIFEDERAVGVRYQTDAGRTGTVGARWIVDASGQSALLGHRLQLRQWDSFFRNLAVYAYFDGAERLSVPDETNIFIESYPHGWFWNIPLHNGWMSVGAVVDSRVGQEGIRAHGPAGFLMDQIAQSPATAAMLKDAKLVSGPVVLRDWSYLSDEVVGDGFTLVGDAACFVDPLFSSGVHLAMTAGVLGAAFVVTALKDPSMRAAAGRVYKDLYYRQYGHFREMAKLFYSSNHTTESYFWEARRLTGAEEWMSPRHAFIHAVAGQSPLGYERAVLERGAAPSEFVEGVRAVEGRRAERRAQMQAWLGGDLGSSPLLRSVPCLAPDVRVQRSPVVADGEFVWGHVLITLGYPEGTPCSAFVAQIIALIDGRRTVSEVIDQVVAGQPEERQGQLVQMAVSALQILYVDGTIAELAGIENPATAP